MCGAATGATEWGGVGATMTCYAAAAGGSTSKVLNGLATRYDGAAANEAGVEHPLPLCGHCMFTMVMRDNGHKSFWQILDLWWFQPLN